MKRGLIHLWGLCENISPWDSISRSWFLSLMDRFVTRVKTSFLSLDHCAECIREISCSGTRCSVLDNKFKEELVLIFFFFWSAFLLLLLPGYSCSGWTAFLFVAIISSYCNLLGSDYLTFHLHTLFIFCWEDIGGPLSDLKHVPRTPFLKGVVTTTVLSFHLLIFS